MTRFVITFSKPTIKRTLLFCTLVLPVGCAIQSTFLCKSIPQDMQGPNIIKTFTTENGANNSSLTQEEPDSAIIQSEKKSNLFTEENGKIRKPGFFQRIFYPIVPNVQKKEVEEVSHSPSLSNQDQNSINNELQSRNFPIKSLPPGPISKISPYRPVKNKETSIDLVEAKPLMKLGPKIKTESFKPEPLIKTEPLVKPEHLIPKENDIDQLEDNKENLIDDLKNNLKNYLITFSAGPTWAKGGETQTFFLQEDLQKSYQNQPRNSSFSTWEVFLGYQKALPFPFIDDSLLGQLGIAIATTTPLYLQGDIWEDADPDFNNFYYRYAIQHTHVALKTKITYPTTYINPYLSGSVGVGFNHAKNFVIIPKIYEEVPAPPFQNGNKTSLTYTFGIGIQQSLGCHYQLAVGYEFENLGQSQLNRAEGQTLNSGLSVSHLFTHGIQFSLSYLM